MLQWVFSDLGRMLTDGSSVDTVTQRLFPRAYLDPTEEEAEAQWQELVHDELVESRLAAMTDVVRSLDTAVAGPGRAEARARSCSTTSRPTHWIGVLNDARLAVGTALEVTAEWDFDDARPRRPELRAARALRLDDRAARRAPGGRRRLIERPAVGAVRRAPGVL